MPNIHSKPKLPTMTVFNFQILLYSLSMFFCILFPQTTSITFNLTSSTIQDQNQDLGLTFFPTASRSPHGLEITPNTLNTSLQTQVGKVTYKESLHLWDKSTGNLTDFSTHFIFVINADEGQPLGDGLTFFLGSDATIMTGSGGMGLPIGPVATAAWSPFVAVEFDTHQDIEWDPVNISPVTHVGIDINSVKSNVTAVWYCNITQGIEYEAWIRYDSSSHNLSVVVTSSTSNTSIYLIVDLSLYLPEWVVFGFSASKYVETHTVKSWDFNSGLEINETNTGNNSVTNQMNQGSKKISPKALLGIVVGSGVLVGVFVLVGFGWWRRSRAKEDDEFKVKMSMENEFESASGPKKFSYGQLSRATNNFKEGHKLGEGGFGGVYKGFLGELSSSIAVKRISKGSKQGIKEYATEVKIISRLRHRNLVQLIGWCHEKKELLLVYEFMENASLNLHLFKGRSLLTWERRYKIAQGLASALLYLHEEWEQCVVHRDVKSSNVMLDSNFNAKLGDFGLARFVDHEKEAETTLLAGTMGYLAPECVITGKTSKESDVYTFGIVLLEIACGRKPFDSKVPKSSMSMMEWMWDLFGIGRLLEAMDPRLCSDFDELEAEQLMTVGLWCAHPDHNFRPKIRQAIHALNFEAPLPILPPKLPELPFFPPSLSTSSASFNTTQNQYSSST